MGHLKLGAFVTIRNSERYIVPHLKMILSGVDKVHLLYTDNVLKQYTEYYSETPDRTLDLLKQHFPEIPVHHTNVPQFNCDLQNEGLEALSDCDLVLKLDVDMLLTKKDWERLIKFLRETDYDCYRLDYSKCAPNYYYIGDFTKGLYDAKEKDPIAASPKHRYDGIVGYPEPSYLIDWPDWTVHHFRGWKEGINDEVLLRDKGSNPWITAPQEIQSAFQF